MIILNYVNMRITSTAFGHNEEIPSLYTCDGANISPPLHFEEIPEETKSLVLIMHDPDAPGTDWLHWSMWNIAPETGYIREGTKAQEAKEGMTDFGSVGYGGPCPPDGIHRYHFDLYALNRHINLENGAGHEELIEAISGHIITQASLIGIYSRGKPSFPSR